MTLTCTIVQKYVGVSIFIGGMRNIGLPYTVYKTSHWQFRARTQDFGHESRVKRVSRDQNRVCK